MSLKHYRYGGSTWARTLACPGWRRLADAVVQRPRSQVAADRGTLLHSAAVHMHTRALKAEALVGYQTPEVTTQAVTQIDARRALIPAMAALKRFIGRLAPVFEQRVQYNSVAGGTADVVAVGSTTGRIADFKFGSERVRAEGNHQLLFYASAYRWPRAVRSVEMAIIQPGARPVLDVSIVGRAVLDNYWRKVHAHLAIAQDPEAPLAKGEHCKWCPAQAICPAYNGDLKLLDPARLPHGDFFK
jgi:uncharacterized protein DUF2800